MNIFATSWCPIESAKNLDDVRVRKMCVESAQLLFNAIHEHGDVRKVINNETNKFDYYFQGHKIYRPTHLGHGCSIWTRDSDENFVWLLTHLEALCDEFRARPNKKEFHKSETFIDLFYRAVPYLPRKSMTDFYNATQRKDLGISFKHIKDPVEAYKRYLTTRWKYDKKNPTWYGKEDP